MTDYLNTLNPEQREAAIHKDGPMIVLAGAGSGKTHTMTVRIKHMIEFYKISPHRILGITFTKKAASEMKERAIHMVGDKGVDVNLATFHSACAQMLRRDIHHLKDSAKKTAERTGQEIGYTSSFTILDSKDQITVLKEVLKSLQIDPKETPPSFYQTFISNFKNALLSPSTVRQMAPLAQDTYVNNLDIPPYVNVPKGIAALKKVGPVHFRNAIAVYEEYQKRLVRSNSCDFDDLIMLTVRLFTENPEVLGYYQEKYRYIMIDEYQDTNQAQYMFVRLLAAKYRNLFVVGDDFQCIYGFRNADVENILRFHKDYPETKQVLLERNYRSVKEILKRANAVISYNQKQHKKKLWTDKESAHVSEYAVLDDAKLEAEYVASKIRRMVAAGEYRHEDFTILYRTNAQSRVFEEVFMKEGMPYTLVGNVSFYERKEIKDIISYLKVLINPSDDFSLKRIINVPKRGIGDTTIKKIEDYASRNEIDFWTALKQASDFLTASTLKKIVTFVELIETIKLRVEEDELGVGMTVDEIYEETGYLKFLEESDRIENTSKKDNLEEFFNVAWAHQQEKEDSSIFKFLEDILMSASQETKDQKVDGIKMMTIHASKGLEFPVVFGVGMEENLLPYYRSISESNEEEERRLCYVLATRAKERLFFSRAVERQSFNDVVYNEPSRFLREMGFAETEKPKKTFVLPW